MLAKVSASEVGEALALRLSMLPLAALDLSGYLDFSSLRPLQTDQASLPPDPLLNPLPPAARPVAPKTAVLAAKSRTNPTIQRFPTFPHILPLLQHPSRCAGPVCQALADRLFRWYTERCHHLSARPIASALADCGTLRGIR